MKGKKFSNVDDLVTDLLGGKDAPAFVDGMHAHRQATATISELVLNRVKQGLTQREVARRMGVSPSKVCRMEDSVDADLSYDDIQKYSDALGLRTTIVFETKEQPRDIASFVYSIGTQLEQLKGLLPSSSGFGEKLTNVYGDVLFPLVLKDGQKRRVANFRRCFAFGIGMLLTIISGCAEMSVRPSESSMDALTRLTEVRTRCVSAENPTGEPGRAAMAAPSDPPVRNVNNASYPAAELGRGWKVNPYVEVNPGETLTLMDAKGPGTIRHIWITTLHPCTNTVLRMYWDGEADPSVEVPLMDFFCQGWGWNAYAPVVSEAVCVNPAHACNCYWPMPFRRHCRIALENRDAGRARVYYYIDYEEGEVGDDIGYFHAQFRQTPDDPASVFTILDGVRGRGQYVGTYLAWGVHNGGWWGEGEVKFFIDDDTDFPTVCSTGLEDYFCGSHNFDRDHRYVTFLTPYAGLCQVLPPDKIYASGQRFGMYRWHVRDPVRFSKRLKVTVQDLGWKKEKHYLPQHSEIRATTFWYQTEPHAPAAHKL